MSLYDDPVILTSLSLLLNQNDELHVAACVANGAEALAALASQHIDVPLLDVDMPITLLTTRHYFNCPVWANCNDKNTQKQAAHSRAKFFYV